MSIKTKILKQELRDFESVERKRKKLKIERPESFERRIKLKEQITASEKVDRSREKARKIGERFSKAGSSLFKGRLLKKPKLKLPKVSARKAIVSGDDRQSLVREGRTGYFKEEMVREQTWLN
jgi:DNA-directed RNA polymerase alpha subunit